MELAEDVRICPAAAMIRRVGPTAQCSETKYNPAIMIQPHGAVYGCGTAEALNGKTYQEHKRIKQYAYGNAA